MNLQLNKTKQKIKNKAIVRAEIELNCQLQRSKVKVIPISFVESS